jgi:DNA invertase Pin-like site-specific DNA recombinase
MIPQPEASQLAAPVPRKTAARWVRVSTEEQASEGRAGLQRQYEATDYIIAAYGYELVASYELIQSGTTVAYSPQFQQLLARIREGLTAVIVSEVSRLMRVDSWESLAVLDVFAKHHCLIIANGQTIDFSNPQGWLSGGVATLVAAAHRKTP